jgi:hypothetical protein
MHLPNDRDVQRFLQVRGKNSPASIRAVKTPSGAVFIEKVVRLYGQVTEFELV